MSQLRHKRGASLTEFLVCAPIVSLLAFAAYDLNKRIEDQQTATILARNALYLGDKVPQDTQQKIAGDAVTAIGNHPDAEELQQLQHAPGADGSGLFVQAAELSYDDDIYRRLDAAPDVRTVENGSAGSKFDTISGATGQVATLGTKALGALETAGADLQLLMKDHARTAGVETTTLGDANAFQHSISLLASLGSRDDKVGEKAMKTERRFAGRFYLRSESGFHPSDHRLFLIPGMIFGRAASKWGDKDDYADDAEGVQSRCMTRFWANDSCGGKERWYWQDKDEHKFAFHIAATAELKVVIIDILRFFGVGEGIQEGLNGVKMGVEPVFDKLEQEMVKKAVGGIQNLASKQLETQMNDQLGKLDQSPFPVGDDVLGNVSPTGLGNALGGQ